MLQPAKAIADPCTAQGHNYKEIPLFIMQSQAKLLLMDQSKLTGSPTVHHKQEILHMLYPPHTHIAANY